MYIGSYQTFLFDTPTGRLGDTHYAELGVSPRTGRSQYIVGFTATRATRLFMNDIVIVDRQQDIRNKTLTTVLGLQYFNWFDESNTLIEEATTEQTITNLRTQPDTTYPVRGQ